MTKPLYIVMADIGYYAGDTLYYVTLNPFHPDYEIHNPYRHHIKYGSYFERQSAENEAEKSNHDGILPNSVHITNHMKGNFACLLS